MAIELFATACVLARTQQLLEERGVEDCERELALCDLFIVEAGRRFRANRVSLESPQDEMRRVVAQHVRDANGYGVEDSILPDEGTKGGGGERRPDSLLLSSTPPLHRQS
jgi:hypothetical protein